VAEQAPIELESYATLAAEIDAGRPADVVLEREGITKESWARAQAYWLKRMADEAHRKRFATTTRYQALFAAKRRIFASRIEREKATVTDPAPPPVEPLAAAKVELEAPIAAELPAVAAPEAPAAVVPEVRLPPPVAAPPPPPMAPAPLPPAPVVSPPAYRAPETAVFAPQAAAAPPPRVMAPLPVVSSSAPAAAGAARNKMATMVVDLELPRSPDVPFKSAAAQAPPPAAQPVQPRVSSGTGPLDMSAMRAASAPAAEPPPKKKQDLGATMFFDEDQPLAKATPFELAPPGDDDDDDAPRTSVIVQEAASRAATPFVEPPPAPPPVTQRLPDERKADSDAPPRTMFFDAGQLLPKEALPFGAGPGGVPAPKDAQVGPSSPQAAPPRPAAAPPAPKKFSINVFASLTAEIAENPADADAIRKRYGISEAEHREESQRWTDEFSKNDELRQRYLGIVARYRGYVQQRKAPQGKP
jgi:hypothetical protein